MPSFSSPSRMAGLVLCLACTPSAVFASGQLYSGTLGNSAIVVELDTRQPGEVTGRYYYDKYRKDLALYGKQQGAALELFEGQEFRRTDSTPHLTLQPNGEGWNGTWSGPKGKRFDIELKPVHLDAPGPDAEPGWQAIYTKSPYDYYRVRSLKLTAGKHETFQGHELQWWNEPLSKISMPEVLTGYPDAERTRINRALRERLWSEVVEYNDCVVRSGEGEADYRQTVKPSLLAPGVVSLEIATGYDCGGPHPDFVVQAMNLDAHTGEPLTLEDVLWVGEGEPLHYADGDSRSDADFKRWADYRSTVFAPWLVAELKKTAPDQMKPQDDEDESCDYGAEEPWRFATYRFTEQGLAFEPSFSSPVCGGSDSFVLPYAVVAAHPGGHKVQLP